LVPPSNICSGVRMIVGVAATGAFVLADAGGALVLAAAGGALVSPAASAEAGTDRPSSAAQYHRPLSVEDDLLEFIGLEVEVRSAGID